MRKHSLLLASIVFAASALARAETLEPDAAAVAAYDQIFATAKPGQSLIALGDMFVPIETVRLWRDQCAGTDHPLPQSASQTGINKWTGGNVYYAFNANVGAADRAHFLDAANEWAAFANLTFIARTAQTNYIMVNDGGPGLFGGNSALGMIGGAQQLNIGSDYWNRGTLVHEIGHALGLIHEHQRSDRETFVTIRAAVAGSGEFVRIPTSTNNGAYDFLSIMHYARNTFAPVGVDNITPKPGFTQFIDIMGNNPDRILSRADREGIALMYGAGPALSTVVTNTKDSGAGSLRTAIYRAFDVATDTPGATPLVSFQIPNTDPNFSGGVFTIRPSDRLPAPGPGTTIDGTTQSAFGGDTNPAGPEVVLNGALQLAPDTFGLGLRLSAGNVTVKGLVIQGFSTQGILITGTSATGNTVAGCYLGTNAAGTSAVPNAFAGLEINGGATGNVIGGTDAAARNVISGNSSQGLFIRGVGTTGNFVRGNFLGLNAAGTGALPNGFSGIEIGESASANTVGGSAPGAGNVLSGNTIQGVYLNAANANVVAGNFIGTNAAGTAAVANGAGGVEIAGGAQSNTVGGTVAGARNVLSGNAFQGVVINGAETSNNVVAGNFAGLNAAGTGAIPNGNGGIAIFSAATNNTIGGTAAGAGNVVSGNATVGVAISGAGTSGNVVAGNFIGTNPTGTASIPNTFSGVGLFSAATSNTIGGATPGAGNLISGNTNQGVLLASAGTNSNVVSGNFIGTNAAGTAAVKNGFAGVEITGGAQNNVIGGTIAAARNILSGNQNQGVSLNSAGTIGNRVLGNYIGTNAAGTGALANGFSGVEIFSSASANTIGGTAPGAGNVISSNGIRNVSMSGGGTNNNVVAGNLIGLDAAGVASPGNAGSGIQIFGGAQGNIIGGTSGGRNFICGATGAGMTISNSGTSGNMIVGNSIGITPGGAVLANTAEGIALFGGPQNNTIGGDVPGAANLISGNGSTGIALYDTATTGNRISRNSIYANGGIGIDLFGGAQNGARVTTNDAGDGDTGPNNLQNYPILTSAVLGTTVTVQGSLNSAPGTFFRLEFFESTAADPSGFGEGQNLVAVIDEVPTNASGDVTFNFTLGAIVPAGHFITVIAINPAGNTSEFSQARIVTSTDTDGDGLPNAYESANGLLVGTPDANLDFDGDGMTNGQEFRAGTDPRNPTSRLHLPPPAIVGADAVLSLPTVIGHTYRIDYANDLNAPNHWRLLTDQIAGFGAVIPITDPGAGTLRQRFYRVIALP